MTFYEVAAIIQSDNSEQLKDVIKEGRVNDIYMPSFLIQACRDGFVECARVLLDYNVNINCRRKFWESVLKSACRSGNVDMLNLIIERGVTFNDSIILDLFESEKLVRNTEIATILVDHIEDVNFRLEGRRNFLYYAACRAGNAVITRILLQRGALFMPDPWGPLETASQHGHLEMVRILLDRNTNAVSECTSPIRVQRALAAASRDGHIDIVRCIVEYGTDAASLNSALSAAVYSSHVEVAAFLLFHGADYNAVGSFNDSAWIQACRYASPATVQLLLDRGADPNAVDAVGCSPLQIALSRPEITRRTREDEAELNQPFYYGIIPLPEVAEQRDADHLQVLITVLLDRGADPNLSEEATGQTPLMRAALKRRIGLTRLLLEYGADVTQVNNEGKSVLDMLGQGPNYAKVRELCTQYIERNMPDVMPVLK